MSRPARLQLSRRKGFDLQAASRAVNGLPAVSVARPGPFGNPFTVANAKEAGMRGSDEALAAACVASFELWLRTESWRHYWDGEKSERTRRTIREGLLSLRGLNLACWCKASAPCHADVLLRLAND